MKCQITEIHNLARAEKSWHPMGKKTTQTHTLKKALSHSTQCSTRAVCNCYAIPTEKKYIFCSFDWPNCSTPTPSAASTLSLGSWGRARLRLCFPFTRDTVREGRPWTPHTIFPSFLPSSLTPNTLLNCWFFGSNNKAKQVKFYIMIEDFFIHLSFSIITENVMVQSCLTLVLFLCSFNFHMNAGNTNICTRSVFDFF